MTTTIKVKKRGPLLVEGDFTITGEDGQPVTVAGTRVALCRCGASKCKPVCDGSHNRIGFGAEEAPPQEG